MLTRETLLRDILDFVKKKRRNWFTKEEFLVYLWHKHRGRVRFETVMRYLRWFAEEGLLARKRVIVPEWGFTWYAVYVARVNAIRAELSKHSVALKLV